jgi:hypothetical protein
MAILDMLNDNPIAAAAAADAVDKIDHGARRRADR